jgi:biofilm PGA synthesis N-glycosyltransferase PgaC
MKPALTYAAVTPVRDELENLRRLADALVAQTVRPVRWVIVDTGSADGTPELARSLAAEHPWIESLADDDAGRALRGAPIVRAFARGVAQVEPLPDVLVKLDADVSVAPDHFERLLEAFAEDPTLGIASGGAEELTAGEWRRRFNTGSSVWGAARAYRRECLADVSPLEERMGWDGIDEVKAHLHGWTTRTLGDLTFRHHRLEGERDGSRWRAWSARGRAAHYMGYRSWYLAVRALHHARTEPAAVAMLSGYVAAALRREAVCSDERVRTGLRREQSLRNLRARRREAAGTVVP